MAEPSKARQAEIGSVLVIEDDPVVALDVAETLREAGAHPVETCPTIAGAMLVLERLRPDVVVLDVHLADRSDGWALAELLPLIGPRPPLVIFATGDPESIPEDIASRGVVLAKPFSGEQLLDRVLLARASGGLVNRLRDVFSSGL